ncbi:MAG: helix-turn-helix transcriptional regulator [Clostridia bacterium]|nr:helix-turn-helix transcriptional regulator [Clostridia bacterium]
MGLTKSVDKVDENGREILTYGTEDFPIAFFDDDLTKVAVPPHWHDEFEIVLITTGKVRVRIAGKEILLSAGEGYFANSGILHAANLLSKEGHQHAMVFSPKIISMGADLIWKQYVAPFLNNPRLPFIRLTPSVPWQREILNWAESAWQYGAYEKKDYPIYVRHFLSKSFSLIAGQAEAIDSESPYTDKYQRDELRVKKALCFIEMNYGTGITLDEIASSAAISASTCLRLFRIVLGVTPIQYVMAYRLQKAIEELNRPGDRTIAEIAYACGFTDASYFDRCFSRAYGMSPSNYMLDLQTRQEE